MVARVIRDVLYAADLLPNGNMVEVRAMDLVACYSGQTTTKTRSAIQQAEGGVLLVDEAQALARKDSCGGEVMEALKAATDPSNNSGVVVIFAGYKCPAVEGGLCIQSLLDMDGGLVSRINQWFTVVPYTREQLAKMVWLKYKAHQLYPLARGLGQQQVTKELGLLPDWVIEKNNARLVLLLHEAAIGALLQRTTDAKIAIGIEDFRTGVKEFVNTRETARQRMNTEGDGNESEQEEIDLTQFLIGVGEIDLTGEEPADWDASGGVVGGVLSGEVEDDGEQQNRLLLRYPTLAGWRTANLAMLLQKKVGIDGSQVLYDKYVKRALSRSAAAEKMKLAGTRLLGGGGKIRPGDYERTCLMLQGVAFAGSLANAREATALRTGNVSVSTRAQERIGKYPEGFQAMAKAEYQATKKSQMGEYALVRHLQQLSVAAEAVVQAVPVKKRKLDDVMDWPR
jgi:hypothetical protein